ncbi:magnesium transporter, partial [Escherichia coli]|nr:magnesium transporter [Escherichia coli]
MSQSEPVEDAFEDEVELDQPRLRQVQIALEARDRMALDDLLEPLHGADIADLIEQI